MPRTLRPVRPDIPDDQLLGDMERYRLEALHLGASAAAVVKASSIVVDERVRLKCRVPVCFGFGTSVNCPPHAPGLEEMGAVLARFRFGLLIRLDVPSSVIVRDRQTILERAGAYKKVFELVSALESLAFYDGHYLAVGFAAGSCKSTYCYKTDCAALKGERCRNELRSRPSMEAVGIDSYRLAAGAGWDIYPIGSDCAPGDIPRGTLLGLVLVD